MDGKVLEWAPFRLRPGADEAALLAASERLQADFLARQEGFLRRQLVKGTDGAYVDLVWWRSMAAAEAAMRKAAESAVCAAYFTLMDADHDKPGEGVLHFQEVGRY